MVGLNVIGHVDRNGIFTEAMTVLGKGRFCLATGAPRKDDEGTMNGLLSIEKSLSL